MARKTICGIDISSKRLLIRVDFNVLLREDGSIASDRWIRAAFPTIRYRLESNESLVLMTHLGRPGGQRGERLGLGRVADRLKELLFACLGGGCSSRMPCALRVFGSFLP